MFPSNDDFQFIPPPEAPIFEPDEEEWKDPLAYITKIYPYAVKVGICKIRPPPDWQPTFNVEVDKFRFTPRIQKLNELEAETRVKLNFFDDIAKFWELQGAQIKLPNVEKKALDLYSLHKIVQREGGYEDVTRLRRWSRVAMLMSYTTGPASSLLRMHYEKILYPYDVFMSGVMTSEEQKKKGKATKGGRYKAKTPSQNTSPVKKDSPAKVETIDLTDTPRRTRYKADTTAPASEGVDYSKNPELKKLKFLAPGPKIAGDRTRKQHGQYSKSDYVCDHEITAIQGMTKRKTNPKKENIFDVVASWVDDYKCHVCDNGDAEESMLLCDSCDASYHIFCLLPPLSSIPPGDWRCPKCVAKECNKPKEAYGFEQANKMYTLQEFGVHADKFKEEYFSMPPQEVPLSVVEKEFWRLVSSIEDDVIVEYGADLHTRDHGSGFPMPHTSEDPEDEEYVRSPWNLNNFPNLDKSVLKYISQDISGMKVPWIYVGMVFSSFCWHTEDHWSYSINYMHWGEPKTWYGVPESEAEKLESCVKSVAPELFETNPDLFHHLVTTCSPMTLMNYGVPVVRTNQCAGEFVVTFPRAYHAGFNTGYNCAEAVNFCPADWLPTGYQCVEHYRMLKRTVVFSHEELVCKIATVPDTLDLDLAKKLYENMKGIVDVEVSLRMAIIEKGIKPRQREAFELLSDDARQCFFCKGTIFFSCVVCSCNKKRITCLHHADEICVCQNFKKFIRYRYTLEELPEMLENLKKRADSFDNWEEKVEKCLTCVAEERSELHALKELICEAENSHFPECELLEQLKRTVSEAEQCGQVASQLLAKKHKTRKASVSGTLSVPRLSLDELKEFVSQIQNLPCIIKESQPIEILMSQVESFRYDSSTLLNADDYDIAKVVELLEHAETIDVELPEVSDLQMELKAAKWVERIIEILNQEEPMSLDVIRTCVDQGIGLRKKQASEQPLSCLKELLYAADKWEEKAKLCLQAKPHHMMGTLEVIVQEAAKVKIILPNVTALTEALKQAKEWSTKVEKVQNDDYYPYYDILEALVARGRPIPVRLEQLPQMESQVTSARAWKDRTARTFVKKGSNKLLIELLRPRCDVGKFDSKSHKKSSIDAISELEKDKVEKTCKDKTVKGKIKTEKDKDFKEKVKSEDPITKLSDERVADEVKPIVMGIDSVNIDDYVSPDPLYVAEKFKEEERLELLATKDLREVNTQKLANENIDGPYCLCRRPVDGFMIRCNLCLEWFHSSCITVPKTVHGKAIGKGYTAWSASREARYLCSLCSRSRRPRLDTILSLLMSLQKLPVRIPEGEALQFLTERSMNWQDRAKKALSRREIQAVLNEAKVESEKAASDKATVSSSVAQSVLMNQLLRVRKVDVAVKEEMERNANEINADVKTEQKDTELECTEEMGGSPDALKVTTDNGYPVVAHPNVTQLQSGSPSRSQSPIDVCTPVDTEPTALSKEHTSSKVLTMSSLPDVILDNLEELMMEGDLLEVGLDEVLHIWAILQIQRPLQKEECMIMDAEYRRKLIKERKNRHKSKRKYEDVKPVVSKPVVAAKSSLKVVVSSKATASSRYAVTSKAAANSKAVASSKTLTNSKTLPNSKTAATKTLTNSKLSGTTGGPAPSAALNLIAGKAAAKKLKGHGKIVKSQGKALASISTALLPSNDDEEDEDDCSAKPCHKPLGEEVEWVQCDKCENWYHVICVGISSEEATTADEYVCPYCKPIPKKKIKLEEMKEVCAAAAPQVSDLNVMAQVATQMMTAESEATPELKTTNTHNTQVHQLDLNSLICLADVSQEMDTAPLGNSNSLDGTHTSEVTMDLDKSSPAYSTSNANTELFDPVVPTDGGEESTPCNL